MGKGESRAAAATADTRSSPVPRARAPVDRARRRPPVAGTSRGARALPQLRLRARGARDPRCCAWARAAAAAVAAPAADASLPSPRLTPPCAPHTTARCTLAGSNASKVARARADNAKAAAAEGKGGGGAKGMAERLQGGAMRKCTICLATFQANQPRVQLAHHVESKHAKDTFEKCFPDFPAGQ